MKVRIKIKLALNSRSIPRSLALSYFFKGFSSALNNVVLFQRLFKNIQAEPCTND